jgi:hypothetical protein
VENGHTVPAVETLEKFASSLEVPLYQLFFEGDQPPALPHLEPGKKGVKIAWGSTGEDARYLVKLLRALSRMSARDRELLFFAAQKMVRGRYFPRARARGCGAVLVLSNEASDFGGLGPAS